ncbi:hypothetical protein COT64_00295 [Candidatus Shapirobacteria bacterium CG09_land_8_20_14_0_10_39_12]|uniref:Uncharacterized protein n=1 Tax=Candidatus Shapirobacteria bacterium CG09_land_8_20_14_0_10_39_12 TaxID=1974885 RepID=A0A2H0WQD2_9BACT|nr:MAG: hypothetical protein COT64_00295 [Candidatus Shapirobacteria bacterium CG09_land_8_20_14_0_10_39_12]
MNLFRKNLKLIIFLGFICILFGIIKFLFSSKKTNEIIPVLPTPTISPVINVTETPLPIATTDPEVKEFYKKLEQDTYKGFPLFDYLPYETDNWKITYIKSLQLEVTLKKDTPAIRQEVLDWIKSKGVDPVTHTIEWIPPK